MKTETAFHKISEIADIPFRNLPAYQDYQEVVNGKTNKGYAGQFLLLTLGLPLDTALNDLEDGEIKTTILKNNMTKEWVPITQVGHLLDEITENTSWTSTKVYKKIENFILVPCHKNSKNFQEWSFAKPIMVSLNQNQKLAKAMAEDYNDIAEEISRIIHGRKILRTINGRNYLMQIRTKDNHPYYPINYRGQVVSNKKYAIGFTTRFIRNLVNIHRGTTSPSQSKYDERILELLDN
jgi:hypothetical protein